MTTRLRRLAMGLGVSLGLSGGALSGLAGCAGPSTAIVNGREMARPDLHFTGQPYSLYHSKAHPGARGASSGIVDDGGHISGHVCGMELLYDVRHEGDHVSMAGFIDSTFSSEIEVRDRGGERVITGTLGGSAGGSVIELHLVGGGLQGRVGFRAFTMRQEGDRLVGMIRISDSRWAKAELDDVHALREMPAADQAAVLSTILTCFGGRIENDVRNPLVVRFGGTAGAEPGGSSTLYQTPNGF